MLKIIGDTEEFLNFDEYYVLQEYSGKDSIGFTLPLDHPSYKGIYEETPIVDTESRQRYLVKAIDEGAQTVNIKASLDLDELSADMLIGYTNNSDTVLNTITGVLPDGWTVQDHAYFNHRRTVELEAATPLEVIDACYDTYSIVCRFDNHSQIVHIYDPESGEPQGAYLTDELNLTAVNMKGKSDSFATRLYARGKDGLTFADVNDGKDYVDDHTYSDKVISVYWKDDRYTIAENLLEDAKKNLAEMAVPQQSYSCSILDLAKAKEYQDGADKNIYSFLDFELCMPVVLIDRRRKRRVTHRVTQIKRYPHYPDKNEITLSTVAPSIQNTVKNVQQQIEKPTSTFNQIKQAQIEAQTELITGNLGGTYIVTLDPETGKPNGWALLDTDSIETAKNVWRMTEGGLGFSSNGFNGPFELAITMDGRIVADFITAGTMNAYIIRGGVLQSQNGMLRFDLDNSNMSVYNASGQLIMRFNNTGQHFYDGGAYIGQIGTNKWKTQPNVKGLVFDLDTNGGYLAWAKRVNPSDDFYTTMLYFFPDDRIDSQGLHLGTNLYTHNNSIHLDAQNHAYSQAWNNGAGFSTAGTFVIADNNNTFISRWMADRISFHKDLYMNGWAIHNQSDERLKTNIRSPTISALDVLCRLQCVQFDWLEGGHESLGIIAQQVQEIAPELVSEDENGVLNINQTRLIQYLLAAIKELAELVIPSPMKALFDKQEYTSHYTEEEKQKFLQQIQEKNRLVPVPPDPPITLK